MRPLLFAALAALCLARRDDASASGSAAVERIPETVREAEERAPSGPASGAPSGQSGADVAGRVSNAMPNEPEYLGPSTRVILNAGLYVAHCDKNGEFSFPSVPLGSYLLEVVHPELRFEPAVVDVVPGKSPSSPAKFVATLYHPSAPMSKLTGPGGVDRRPAGLRRLKRPLSLSPISKLNFFERKSKFAAIRSNAKWLLFLAPFGLMWFFSADDADDAFAELKDAWRSRSGDEQQPYASPFLTLGQRPAQQRLPQRPQPQRRSHND
eukprot:Selendium_serpulae@DN3819_c0_g1_i2.p2